MAKSQSPRVLGSPRAARPSSWPHRPRGRREDRRGRAAERRPPDRRGRAARARTPDVQHGRPGDGGDRMGQGRRASPPPPLSTWTTCAGNRYLGTLAPAPVAGPVAHRLEGADGDGGPFGRRPHAAPEHELLEAAGRLPRRGRELHERQRAVQARPRRRTLGVERPGYEISRGRERHADHAAGRGRHAAQPGLAELRAAASENRWVALVKAQARAEPRAGLRPAQLGRGGRRPLPRAEPEGQASWPGSGSASTASSPVEGDSTTNVEATAAAHLRPVLLRLPEGGRSVVVAGFREPEPTADVTAWTSRAGSSASSSRTSMPRSGDTRATTAGPRPKGRRGTTTGSPSPWAGASERPVLEAQFL